MGWYDARTSELKEMLKNAAEGMAENVRRTFENATNSAGSEASSALESMIDFSERASTGNLGTARRWQDRCDTAKSNISRTFGDAAKDNMMPPAMQLFFYKALEHELAFFDTLKQLPTPQL